MTSPPSPTKTINVGLGGIAIKPERLRALRPDRVRELAESMKISGLLQPIVLRTGRGEGYWLVAGWHRFEAAKLLKWPSIRANIFEGMKADATELAEIDENLIHIDLTPAERAMHIGRRKDLYEKLKPETVSVRKRGGPGRGNKNESQHAISFIDDAAKKTGKHRATVARDAKRAGENSKNANLLADIVGTSLDSGAEIDALLQLPPDEQRDLIERAKAGEKVSAKTRLKQVKRAEREKAQAHKTAAAAVALNQEPPAEVLLIDWALRFDAWSEKGEDRSAENHYECGPVDQMIALKPPMADNVVAFAWTSAPMLDRSLSILKAWNFQYKSYSVWDKEIDGTGYWTRSRVELILIATKGNVPAPAPGEQFPQLFRSRRREHSRKPDEVYEEIERLYPNMVKLEMFQRHPRPGWRGWGNEAAVTEAAE